MPLRELIDNVAILTLISLVYVVAGEVPAESGVRRRVLAGAFFGVAAIVGMLLPMEFAPGIIYDGRSVILSVAGLLTGAPGALTAGLIAAMFRIHIGGAGMVVGVSSIAVSSLLGLAGYHLRRRSAWWSSSLALALLGLIVYGAVFLLDYLLLFRFPGGSAIQTVWPILVGFYPAVFVLISKTLLEVENSRSLRDRVESANQLYRSLFDTTHAVMLTVSPEDGTILDANSAAERFYGWSRAELIHMGMADINALSPDEVRTNLALAATGEQEAFELRHRLADGSVRDVRVHSGRARIEGQEVLHSIVVDVTEQRRAERERDLMLFSMDHAALGVLRAREKDAVVEYANEKAATLLGYSREELPGVTIFDLDPGETPDTWPDRRKIVKECGHFTFEATHRRKDGSEYPAEVTTTYLAYEGTEYALTFFQDISERKAAAEAISRSLREKETLLQEVHHRVKNNLSVLASLINLQASHVADREQALSSLSKTRDRINTMAEVHNTLDMATDYSRIDLSDFLTQRSQSLGVSYRGGRRIEVRVTCGAYGVDLCHGVPLGLAVNELLTNAFKHAFTDRDEGVIAVSVAEEGGSLVITVRDNGRGIADRLQEGPGDSLGLFLVQLLSDQIGATFSLDSSSGTVAQLRLPLAKEPSPAIPAAIGAVVERGAPHRYVSAPGVRCVKEAEKSGRR